MWEPIKHEVSDRKVCKYMMFDVYIKSFCISWMFFKSSGCLVEVEQSALLDQVQSIKLIWNTEKNRVFNCRRQTLHCLIFQRQNY